MNLLGFLLNLSWIDLLNCQVHVYFPHHYNILYMDTHIFLALSTNTSHWYSYCITTTNVTMINWPMKNYTCLANASSLNIDCQCVGNHCNSESAMVKEIRTIRALDSKLWEKAPIELLTFILFYSHVTKIELKTWSKSSTSATANKLSTPLLCSNLSSSGTEGTYTVRQLMAQLRCKQ